MSCHGADGRGGVPVMMVTKLTSDICYSVLTEKEPRAYGLEQVLPRYTDGLIDRAIIQGINPAGKSLDWTMLRWEMCAKSMPLLELVEPTIFPLVGSPSLLTNGSEAENYSYSWELQLTAFTVSGSSATGFPS